MQMTPHSIIRARALQLSGTRCNKDIESLSGRFSENFLQVNGSKTQTIILDRSHNVYGLKAFDNVLDVIDTFDPWGFI